MGVITPTSRKTLACGGLGICLFLLVHTFIVLMDCGLLLAQGWLGMIVKERMSGCVSGWMDEVIDVRADG